TGSLCANLPSSSAPVSGILLGVLVAQRRGSKIPCGTSSHSSPPLNLCRKIKNPASSAGRNHPHGSGSTRCSTSFYPVLVKNPTIGSTSRLRFFSGSEDFFDPTVMPLNSPQLLRALGPSVIIAAFLVSSSPRNNYFFLSPVNSVQIRPTHPLQAG